MAEWHCDELIVEFYGIDAAVRRVDNVGVYASGKMAHWSVRRGYVFHMLKDRAAREEIERLFGWSEITEINPATPNHRRRQILAEMQARAGGEQPKIQDEQAAPAAVATSPA